MAAPENNEFWKLRSKHGRKRLFESSPELWEAACEFFQWTEENPLKERIVQGGKRFTIPKMRPFTYQGLCRYLNCNVQYFNEFEESLIGKIDATSKDFSAIITRIREVVYQQKFEGAACGFLHHSIIARDLQLVDKKEVENKSPQIVFQNVSKDYEIDENGKSIKK